MFVKVYLFDGNGVVGANSICGESTPPCAVQEVDDQRSRFDRMLERRSPSSNLDEVAIQPGGILISANLLKSLDNV